LLKCHIYAGGREKWMTFHKEPAMSDHAYDSFFLRPEDAVQRRYETLRAVIVEQQPMKKAAQQFRVSYGTVRNWVSEFRTQWNAGQLSPFLFNQRVVVHLRNFSTIRNRKLKSPMCASCLWKLAVV
jgi:hypothetical protein